MADTPPGGGVPTVATIGTLSRQLAGLAGQVHGARNDIDTIAERQKSIAEDVSALRKRLCDDPALAAAGIALAPESRPSRAARAAQAAQTVGRGAAGFGKYSAIALGVLSIAAQVAAQFKPGLVGPIQLALQLLAAIGGPGP